jgi:hypothetical protein
MRSSRKNGRRASRNNRRASRNNRRAASRNNRHASRKNNRRNTRKQRGGDANDGGYGQSQQYFNPDWARPSGPAFSAEFSTAPTADMIRPVLGMSPSTNLSVVQGQGAVPPFQESKLIGGARRKNNRKNRSIKKNRK